MNSRAQDEARSFLVRPGVRASTRGGTRPDARGGTEAGQVSLEAFSSRTKREPRDACVRLSPLAAMPLPSLLLPAPDRAATLESRSTAWMLINPLACRKESARVEAPSRVSLVAYVEVATIA